MYPHQPLHLVLQLQEQAVETLLQQLQQRQHLAHHQHQALLVEEVVVDTNTKSQ